MHKIETKKNYIFLFPYKPKKISMELYVIKMLLYYTKRYWNKGFVIKVNQEIKDGGFSSDKFREILPENLAVRTVAAALWGGRYDKWKELSIERETLDHHYTIRPVPSAIQHILSNHHFYRY